LEKLDNFCILNIKERISLVQAIYEVSWKGVAVVNTEPVQHQQEEHPGDNLEQSSMSGSDLAAPGVPIVRSNTPRPLSFERLMSDTFHLDGAQPAESEVGANFPVEAPTAPPLPEEFGERGDSGNLAVDSTPLPLVSAAPETEQSANEFIWLFEYGLEMDISYLNNETRLNGLALLYGPAVLKGYELTFDVVNARAGEVVATILSSRERGAEVWGILYRVSAKAINSHNGTPSLLDKIHSAAPPEGLFERLPVTVYEAYRHREIDCITYIASATARNHYHLLPRDRQSIDPNYMQRLLDVAKKQKLPGDYLQTLHAISAPQTVEAPFVSTPDLPIEQNTEPLPVIADKEQVQQPESPSGYKAPSAGIMLPNGIIIFAIYMVVALAAILVFALIEGFGNGNSLFTASFIPPGVPWFILIYGFMGGCLSSIVTLARSRATQPPTSVLITWFARPFIGAVLSVIAFLLLNSGLFVLNGNIQQHDALFSLLALVAGTCEGWLFIKDRTR
jgi:hypothetical protein